MAQGGSFGFLQNLTGTEMIAIAIVALVVLGPERLPELFRNVGRAVAKVKSMTEGLQSEVSDVMADPSMQPIKELGEIAARPRQKLAEYTMEAEAEARARTATTDVHAESDLEPPAVEPGDDRPDDEPADTAAPEADPGGGSGVATATADTADET